MIRRCRSRSLFVAGAGAARSWLGLPRRSTGRLSANPVEDIAAHDRDLGAPVPAAVAGDHAAAAADRLEPPDPVPPDARAVRVLLRDRAPAQLPGARPGASRSSSSSPTSSSGRFITAGHGGLPADGAAGGDVDQGLDPPAGAALAAAAPPGLLSAPRPPALHFIWKVKVVIGEPVYYAAILALLLGFRLVWRLRPSRQGPPPTCTARNAFTGAAPRAAAVLWLPDFARSPPLTAR